jgi:hypothetical protein
MSVNTPLIKTIVINGENFYDLQGFYNEVERVLADGREWRSNNNLSSFEKLLAGEGGVLKPREPAVIIWKSISKSKSDFHRMSNGSDIYLTIIRIIRSQEHIEFVEQ